MSQLPQHVSDRHLEEQVIDLDLIARAAELLHASPHAHSARTLAKQGSLRVVLLTLPKGTRIPQHQTAAPISVQVIFGQIRFGLEGHERVLPPGRALVVAGDLPHDLEADLDSAVLLTLSNRG